MKITREHGDVTPLMKTVRRWWFEEGLAAFMNAAVLVDSVEY